MKARRPPLALLIAFLVLLVPPVAAAEAEILSFTTDDGVEVHADLHLGPRAEDGPLLLLFHQGGGDGRGEYGPLVPRLLEAGYSTLLVDQRSGGSVFGGTNRTRLGVLRTGGQDHGYCAAYPDLVAALEWAQERGFSGPVVAWGSSYSGALVLRLAAEHGDRLAAVLAFSPASGEAMEGCRAETFASGVKIPALAVRPTHELERETTRRSFEALAAAGLDTHVPDAGTHGSSTLVPERVERAGAAEAVADTWRAVLAFLAEHASPGVRR